MSIDQFFIPGADESGPSSKRLRTTDSDEHDSHSEDDVTLESSGENYLSFFLRLMKAQTRHHQNVSVNKLINFNKRNAALVEACTW